MTKKLIAASVLAAACGSANAAFFQPGSTGTINLTAGCFAFGSCTIGSITDNALMVGGNGSGIAGDGLVGVIGFSTADGNNLTITSYSQDSYTGTPGGTFALTGNVGASSGFVSDAGDLSLTLSRSGYAEYFAYLWGSAWNVDNSGVIAGQGDAVSGALDALTTGADSAWTPGKPGTPTLVGSGSALASAGVGEWTGSLVNFGNIGAAWGSFDSTPYSEQFNVQVLGTAASPVPVPAAVWLFGSAVVGLTGLARRRKAAA